MARGSAISRVRNYFKEAPMDEVQVVFTLVQQDIASRKRVTSKPAVTVPRKRRRVKNHEVVQPAEGYAAQQEVV